MQRLQVRTQRRTRDAFLERQIRLLETSTASATNLVGITELRLSGSQALGATGSGVLNIPCALTWPAGATFAIIRFEVAPTISGTRTGATVLAQSQIGISTDIASSQSNSTSIVIPDHAVVLSVTGSVVPLNRFIPSPVTTSVITSLEVDATDSADWDTDMGATEVSATIHGLIEYYSGNVPSYVLFP